ncbi:STAS domain-containing protein, partial [Streptomyces sp. TRM76130]|nr:STAS domain-containing protein [Streptomyces sp. TRM76130]
MRQRPAPLTRHLRVHEDRGYAVLEFHGEIDLAVADEIAPVLDRATGDPGARVVLDLSGVEFFDCSGLRLLVRARQRVLDGG